MIVVPEEGKTFARWLLLAYTLLLVLAVLFRFGPSTDAPPAPVEPEALATDTVVVLESVTVKTPKECLQCHSNHIVGGPTP